MSENTEFDSTMEALRRAESALPDFTSSYDGEIRRLYDEIVNRPAFRYDPRSDPLYQSYRSQMVTEGERAMRDTMGQAAALTGGYGSSYAQGVGQQEYELYLQRLGQVMPQLYKAAWERWSAEGDELKGLFDTTMTLARDEIGREKDRFDEAARLEEQSYQRGQDKLDRAEALEKRNYDRSEKSYQKLMSLISQSGYSPSDSELSAAGMSRAQAQALRNSYLMKNPMAMVMSGNLPAGLSALTGSYAGGGSAKGSSYAGGGYSGTGGSTGNGAKTAAGSKEQIKLAANQKGSNTSGKTRRL